MIAIVPAAGIGKRMAAVTGGRPKELLEIGGKPVIEWVIDEALEAGADNIVVVSSPDKAELNEMLRRMSSRELRIEFQYEQKGLAHAVDAARCSGRDAMILMGDSFYSPSSPLASLGAAIAAGAWASVAVRRPPREQLHLYGVVAFDARSGRVAEMVEKPPLGDEPGDWAVAGRYAFSADAMEVLHDCVASWMEPGEVNLTHVLRQGLSSDEDIWAAPITHGQVLYDCGDPMSFAAAQGVFGR